MSEPGHPATVTLVADRCRLQVTLVPAPCELAVQVPATSRWPASCLGFPLVEQDARLLVSLFEACSGRVDTATGLSQAAAVHRLEIERKFLVRRAGYRDGAQVERIRQGFLRASVEGIVRVRLTGERGLLTVKGPTVGARRAEVDLPIPRVDAELLLERCATASVEKNRYCIADPGQGVTWEVDEFLGDNEGLVVAEVELESEEAPLRLPDWIAAEDEVTGEPRYHNACLASHPFRRWSVDEGR